MKKQEHYFTPYGTESDHSAIEYLIRCKCQELNLTLVYYRKFKKFHVPLWRECKIKGGAAELQEILKEIGPQTNYFHVQKMVEQIADNTWENRGDGEVGEVIAATLARIRAYLDKLEWGIFGKNIEHYLEVRFKYGVFGEPCL